MAREGTKARRKRARTPGATAVLLMAAAIGVVAAHAERAAAGAWTQPAGSFYVKASFTVATADEQIKCCVDERQPLLSYTDRGNLWQGDLSIYGEYGLPFEIPGGLTVLGSASYKFIELDTERALRRTQGFADVVLGLRWGVPWTAIAPVVLAIQVDGKIPTGYTTNLPDGEDLPWLGNGVFELTTTLLAGVSLYPLPLYATGGVGFRWRGQDENVAGTIDYANEVPYALEVGATPGDRVLVQLLLDGVLPLGDVGEIDIAALTPPASRSLRIGLGLGVRVWEGLQIVGEYRRTLRGTNVVLYNELTAGVAWAQ